MELKKFIWIIALILISSAYAELEPGRLTINDVEIPYSVEGEEKVYQCPGKIINSLCYYGSSPIQMEQPYEDNNIKVWFEYPLRVNQGDEFDFKLFIKNKKNSNINFQYIYSIVSNDVYELINHDFPTGQKEISLILSADETKEFNARFKAVKPNFFPDPIAYSFFDLNIKDVNKFELKNYVAPLQGKDNNIICGNEVFPATYTDFEGQEGKFRQYYNSKCCNGVFYPSFECCSDSDCNTGKCIDGICIDRMGPILGVRDSAIGNKKILLINLDNTKSTDSDACQSDKTPALEMINGIENYFDSMAAKYLNENSNFINFKWDVYADFNTNELNLNDGADHNDILNAISKKCGINQDEYNQIILIGLTGVNAEYGGLSGRPITSMWPISFYNERWAVMAHEMLHNFGCRDLYGILGGSLQWNDDVFGYSKEQNNLQVCRGEMGWADLNGNGVPEIKDYSWQPEEIEISYPKCESTNPSHCIVYNIMRDCNRCDLCKWFDEYNHCCPKDKVWYEKRQDCVTPEEADEEPPTVKLLNEIPQTVEPDTAFEINLAVDDISGVEDVNLNLGYSITIYPDRYEPPSGTQLAAVNTKYIASVDTSYLSGSYKIYVSVKDRKGNEKKELLGSFNIEETSLCREVYPGYNNLNDNRFNIVFVGLGYPNKRNFVEFARRAADIDSNVVLEGIFKKEPFKSNRNRFNFWYVDEIGQIPGDCDANSGDTDRCAGRIGNYGGYCAFNNKVVIGLVNDEFRSWARYRKVTAVSSKDYFYDYGVPLDILDDDFLHDYCSDADLNQDGRIDPWDKYYDINEDKKINEVDFNNDAFRQEYLVLDKNRKGRVDGCILVNYRHYVSFQAERNFAIIWNEIDEDSRGTSDYPSLQKAVITAIHEFGHTYASLGDEYLENNNRNKDEKNCVNWVWKTPGVNVRQQACLGTAQWKDMIGDGCGQEGIIDCVKNNNYEAYDPNSDDFIRSEDPNLDWSNFDNDYANEIYCYSGCGYQFNKQRSTYNSIMRSPYTAKNYGLFNEKLICEQIKADTGKVGGYCTEKFSMT